MRGPWAGGAVFPLSGPDRASAQRSMAFPESFRASIDKRTRTRPCATTGFMQAIFSWVHGTSPGQWLRIILLPIAAGLLLAAANASDSLPVQIVTPPQPATAVLQVAGDDIVTAESDPMPLPLLVRTAASDTDTVDRQLGCLATAVYFESRGEPLEGQLAVAQSILNRVDSGRYADTICAVIKQPGQFAFGRARAPRSTDDWRTAVAVARIARDNLWPEMAQGAMSFHASRVSPGWPRRDRIARIGNHIFYR